MSWGYHGHCDAQVTSRASAARAVEQVDCQSQRGRIAEAPVVKVALMIHVAMFVISSLVHDNRVRREAETLAGAGYDVTVFSPIAPANVPRLGWDGLPNLRAVAVPPPIWQKKRGLARVLPHAVDLLRWGGSLSLLEAAKGHPTEIYHAHDLDTLPAAASLARRHRARLVYDSHELFVDHLEPEPDASPSPRLSRLKQRIARDNFARLERTLIVDADAVIMVSDASAAELASRYGIARPTIVLNTPRYSDLSAGSDYLRRRLGVSAEQRLLLLQGGILVGRGLPELVQSLPLLPDDYHLVFLGFNLGTYQEPIRREIRRLRLESRVYLLDALPPEQLGQATASADVGILLLAGHNKNHQLTLPNKLFEYMMAGLPFIANDRPAVGRIVRETGAGLTIPAITPAAIASGVRDVLDDPIRYQTMRQAGLRAAREKYNWERQAAQLLALYAGLQ
jgi:glycogen synthase